jgi:PAS domain S-box-containing protein
MPDSDSKHLVEETGIPTASLLLAAIIDSSDDVIISKNLEGIITSWNRSAQRVFGYTEQEMIGQPVLRLLPPERAEEETRILARLRRGERVDHYETVRVCKDGRRIDVSLTISPIKDETGKIIGASKIARDITEQKHAIAKLAAAHDELARANRIKAEFISTLSHELRTPLNAILGWIQILKEEPSREDLTQGLDVIERNVRVQSQLIEDLLDMSRIEAGKLLLDVQRVDLAAVIQAAIESVQPGATAKGIHLTSLLSNVKGVVMGDKNRLQQIVWNLLINALKFTPKGGRVHVTIEHANSEVKIAVADSGTGIAREFLDHIFDRFSQADASTTRRHGGLGLGLSIVKNLVELHGGSVRAESGGIGSGSRFVVCLPLLPVAEAPKRADDEQDLTGNALTKGELEGVSVLAVDDDHDSTEIVRRILERSGAHVRTAASMHEALARFEEAQPDVLLSDISMPEHDGYELVERIRVLPGGRNVPAVALTALARSEDRTRALQAGFQLHVAKPVEAGELIAVVRNLANLRSSR